MDGDHTPSETKHDLLAKHDGPSPINKLPHDVLSQIFLASLSPMVCRPNIHSSPVILGRICRSWRKLALDMPLLWNHIVGVAMIRPCYHDEAATKAELDKEILAVDEYLARSQNSPLEISLVYITVGVEAPPPYFVTKVNAIMGKILPHSPRWRNVMLNIPNGSVQTVFSQLGSGVPRLKSLIVSESSFVYRRPTLHINLSSAHQLERLQILIPTEVHWGNAIMHQMRDLNVSPTSLSSFLRCIGKCPSITSVDFFPDAVQTLSAPPAEIHIHCLSSLVKCRLDQLNQTLFSGLLDNLHLPVLKHLDIFTKYRLSDSSSFVRFMHRSQPPLETLSIIAHGMPTAHLLDCLQRIPCLTVLRMDIAYFSNNTIQRFLTPSPAHGGSVLCPNLRSLWLLGKTEGACQSAAKVVVHRWHNASERTCRIRQVWISDWEYVSFVGCDGIAGCNKEGLELSRDASWTKYWQTGQFGLDSF
ncbi:hypothetical protein BD410DRAFT_829529 [Rickenella mellea]|uniref:Uncharacterized protein n=1 Tax=Rickenella mellea TaxID=50990 RepID=A0A4Y7Q0G9_9AGAM|nr:hypothetical protein BD410DRAFT_829529 [Rickenella mellea]